MRRSATSQPLPFSLSVADRGHDQRAEWRAVRRSPGERRARPGAGDVRVPERRRAAARSRTSASTPGRTPSRFARRSPRTERALNPTDSVGTRAWRQRFADRPLRGEAGSAVLVGRQGEPRRAGKIAQPAELRPGIRLRRNRRPLLRGVRRQAGPREGRLPAASDSASGQLEGSGARSHGVLGRAGQAGRQPSRSTPARRISTRLPRSIAIS